MKDYIVVHVENRKEEHLVRKDQIQRVGQTRAKLAQIYIMGRIEPVLLTESYDSIALLLDSE